MMIITRSMEMDALPTALLNLSTSVSIAQVPFPPVLPASHTALSARMQLNV